MRKTIITLGFGTLAAIALPLAASADEQEGPKFKRFHAHHMMPFEELDADGDKAISRDEFVKFRADRFAKADANGDGSVSAAEFNAFMEQERERRRQEMQDRMFKKLDANGDGQISREEMEAHSAKAFERMDRNKDGKLSADDHDRKFKDHRDGKMKDRKDKKDK